MRRNIESARALVTGASSGIGREIALRLAREGARLIVTARREDRLQNLVEKINSSGGEAYLLAGDITDPLHRKGLLDLVQEKFTALDILVNNAGVGAIGPLMKAKEDRLRRIMEVNFFAPIETIRQAYPLLKEARNPIIVNISSVLGHRAVPKKSEYCASKFALHGISDSLRAELGFEGIDLLLVSPSTTESEFFDSVLEKKAVLPWLNLPMMSAQSVAKKTVRAIRRGKHEIILSPGGKLLVWLDRLMPTLSNLLTARFG